MGKISNYTRALVAKLQDVFVCDQTDSNVTSTKSVTVEQIGDAICGEQVHADLETDDQTIIGGINEVNDKVGSLSTLTTTDKSSIVGAVNEVNAKGYNDLSGKPIRSYMVSSSNPITIQGQIVAGYATFIIIGFVASLGGVVLAVQMSNGNLSKVIDLLTGNPFSSSHLTFSGSNSQLTIGSDVNSNSNLMIWG